MSTAHLPKHLSVSAVQTYARCPRAWYARYVEKQRDEPSPQMTFGTAFHAGMEAIHRHQDGELAFALAHSALLPRPIPGAEHGLALLKLYRERGIMAGEPEYKFRVYLPDRARVPLPIVGFIDLLCPNEVVEIKTARGGWTEARAALEWQAAVYAYAFKTVRGIRPAGVRYLIFSTTAPKLDEYMTRPGGDELRLFETAAAGAYAGIVRGDFAPCGSCWFCRPPSEPTADAGRHPPLRMT